MWGRSIKLFKVFGFEIRLDVSWLIIAALLIWSLAAGVFPYNYPGLPMSHYWWMAVAGALTFFGSIVVHELSHSLVARRYEIPMKGITLFVFGGVAEMGSEPQSAKAEFLMAAAGPLTSIALGFLFRGLALAGSGWPVEVVGVLLYLSWINWILAGFNLIPAFPLDGGRILRAALWRIKGDVRWATRVAAGFGSAFGFLLMAYALYRLIFGDFISAVWYFLIGTFLRNASRISYQQMLLRTALAGEPVSRFMNPHPVWVRPDLSLRELVDNYIFRYHYKSFPVVASDDVLQGCVSARDLSALPETEWSTRTVADVAKPCAPGDTVSPDTDAFKALSMMQTEGAGRLLVTDHGHLLAIVSMKDLLRFFAAKLELEGFKMRLPPALGGGLSQGS
jgi:Zn-dependent protease/CBS domain-containing protein